jgi:hypothetical protein
MRLGQVIRLGVTCMLLTGSVGLTLANAAHAAQPPRHTHDDDDDDDEGPVPTGEIVVTARKLDAARASINPALGASSYLLTNDALEKRPSGDRPIW